MDVPAPGPNWFLNRVKLFRVRQESNKNVFFLLSFTRVFSTRNTGERRGLNPRVMESQSIALPLGYARQPLFNLVFFLYEKTTGYNKTCSDSIP